MLRFILLPADTLTGPLTSQRISTSPTTTSTCNHNGQYGRSVLNAHGPITYSLCALIFIFLMTLLLVTLPSCAHTPPVFLRYLGHGPTHRLFFLITYLLPYIHIFFLIAWTIFIAQTIFLNTSLQTFFLNAAYLPTVYLSPLLATYGLVHTQPYHIANLFLTFSSYFLHLAASVLLVVCSWLTMHLHLVYSGSLTTCKPMLHRDSYQYFSHQLAEDFKHVSL
jgi:hypothetical protein